MADRPEDRRLPLPESGQLLPEARGELVGHGKVVYLAALVCRNNTFLSNVIYPGAYYLVAYWMGRYYGFLKPGD